MTVADGTGLAARAVMMGLAVVAFAGEARRYIGSDGIYPTDAGHRRMADKVLAHLN